MLPNLATPDAFKNALTWDGPVEQRSREGRRWEFKEARKPPKDLAMILASFANTIGGALIVGIGETTVNGIRYANGLHDVPDADKLLEDVLNHCAECLKPVPINESFPLAVDGKNVVVFHVEPSVRIVAHQHNTRLKYPYRDSHGTKYMDAARVEMHIMDENRSKKLRFHHNFDKAKGFVGVLFIDQDKGAAFDKKNGFNTPRSNECSEFIVRKSEDEYLVVSADPPPLVGNEDPSNSVLVPFECIDVILPNVSGGVTLYVMGHVRVALAGERQTLHYVPRLAG